MGDKKLPGCLLVTSSLLVSAFDQGTECSNETVFMVVKSLGYDTVVGTCLLNLDYPILNLRFQ